MNIISRACSVSLVLSVVVSLVGCAEFPNRRPIVPITQSDLLYFSWTCEAGAAAGSQTSYGVRLRVSGSGDLTGDLGEEFQLTGGLMVSGSPAGHCQDIGEQAVSIAQNHKCATRGLTYFASTGSAHFRASCSGGRGDLVIVMSQLLRHAQTFSIPAP